MTPQPWWTWIAQAGGWTLAAVGLLTLMWALFWDHSRGRRRCPKCWYDMTGLPILVCPECGRDARREQSLFRTRRRWSLALLSLLAVGVGVQLSLAGGPGRRGGAAFLPTIGLVLNVDDYSSNDPLTEALVERLQSGEVFPWDRYLAARREVALQDIDWSKMVAARSKWPVGVPVRMYVRPTSAVWSVFEWRRIGMRTALVPDEEASWSFSPPHIHVMVSERPKDWITLPGPIMGVNHYVVDLGVSGSSGVRMRGSPTVAVEGVATIDEAIAPESDPLVVGELLDNLRWVMRGDEAGVNLWVGTDSSWFGSRRDVSYAYRVQVVREDVQVAESAVDGTWATGSAYFRLYPMELGESATHLEMSRWSVKILPAPDVALTSSLAPRYWNGRAVMALSQLPLEVADHLVDLTGVEQVPYDPAAQAKLAGELPGARQK